MSRSSSFMLLLWKMYLQPTLKYASQVYHAQHLKLVQRRFTRRIDGLREVPYENRLFRLELPTLSMKTLYLNLKYIHKLLRNQLNVSPHDLDVDYLVSHTRGNGISLAVNHPRSAVTAKNFAVRISKNGNRLLFH